MTYRQHSALNKLGLIALTLALFMSVAQAQVTPLIFERSTIRILSGAPAPRDGEVVIAHQPIPYDIEVRPEDAMKLEYIHTLNTLTEKTGVMIAFAAPSMVALPMMKVYTPVDTLFVTADGTIAQILPNAVLGNLQQDVLAHEPIKAFLFLKAGEVSARAIRPRDVISGPMFTPAPPVME